MKPVACMIRSILLLAALMTLAYGAQDTSAKKPASVQSQSPASPADAKAGDDTTDMLEGDRRFRNNCGRCHASPHKLSPRMMATAIRHMRVRATLTDEDMRLILKYMTK